MQWLLDTRKRRIFLSSSPAITKTANFTHMQTYLLRKAKDKPFGCLDLLAGQIWFMTGMSSVHILWFFLNHEKEKPMKKNVLNELNYFNYTFFKKITLARVSCTNVKPVVKPVKNELPSWCIVFVMKLTMNAINISTFCEFVLPHPGFLKGSSCSL